MLLFCSSRREVRQRDDQPDREKLDDGLKDCSLPVGHRALFGRISQSGSTSISAASL